MVKVYADTAHIIDIPTYTIHISLATNLFSHFHFEKVLEFQNADRLKVNMVKCFKIGKMFILWVLCDSHIHM